MRLARSSVTFNMQINNRLQMNQQHRVQRNMSSSQQPPYHHAVPSWCALLSQWRLQWLFILLSLSLVFVVTPSWAETIPEPLRSANGLPELASESWLLFEPETGWVLAEKDADKRIEPASLTKLMAIYVAFDLLDKGQLQLDDKVLISKKAWRMEGSRMFAEVDDKITLINILKSIIIQSGNDASVALAEHVSGTESAFVEVMNAEADALNLKNTHFVNPTGLPHPDHYSSARDIAVLSAAIIQRFPQYFPWFSVREFEHNDILQQNRNRLLWRSDEVDGLKTGHTESAGYCLAATSKKDDMRMIAVVTSAESDQQRSNEAMALLRYGHANYQLEPVLAADKSLGRVRVYGGEVDYVDVVPLTPYMALSPKGQQQNLTHAVELPTSISAPLEKGQTIGVVNVLFLDQAIANVPMVFADDVPHGGLMKRGVDAIKQKIDGLLE